MSEQVRTHDYTARTWGHDYGVLTVESGGKMLGAYGWGEGIHEGDFLLLPNGERSTRYQVQKIRYADDPRDQWFAELRYAPRAQGEVGS